MTDIISPEMLNWAVEINYYLLVLSFYIPHCYQNFRVKGKPAS